MHAVRSLGDTPIIENKKTLSRQTQVELVTSKLQQGTIRQCDIEKKVDQLTS